MAKVTPGDDDLSVRLSWPNPPSPFSDPKAGSPAADGKHAMPGLDLVLGRLDALELQLTTLTGLVEALVQRSRPGARGATALTADESKSADSEPSRVKPIRKRTTRRGSDG